MYRKGKPDVLTVRKFVNLNRGIIYGMMLGDATIDGRGENARMRIRHCESQMEYVLYKHGLLREVAASEPSALRWSNGHVVWGFCTSTSTEWQSVWSRFHQDSKAEVHIRPDGRTVCIHRKVLTAEILRDLNDHGLAIWIMDDGCLDVHRNESRRCWSKRLVLSTDGFTADENRMIQAWFLERYEVSARISPNCYRLKDGTVKRSTRIRIGWSEYQKMIPRLERYFIPSMRYKIEPSQDKGRLADGEPKTHSDLAGDRENQSETTGRPA